MCTPFMFDPAEYENVTRGWEDLRTRIESVRDRFTAIEALVAQAPAEDPATTAFMSNARRAVDAANRSNALMRGYTDSFLVALERTASAYQDNDDGNARTITGIPAPGNHIG